MTSRSPLRRRPFALCALLLLPVLALRAGDGDDSPSGAGREDKGYAANSTLTTVAGIQANQYDLRPSFEIPITPVFKVADTINYAVTVRYNADPLTGPAGMGILPPPEVNPFGFGNEYTLGVVYEAYSDGAPYDNDGDVEYYRRDWYYMGPDGSRHALHLMGKYNPYQPNRKWLVDLVRNGESSSWSNGGGNTVLATKNGSSVDFYGNWTGAQSDLVYMTTDGSMILGRVTLDGAGQPAFWTLYLPDGRRAIFAQKVAPANAVAWEKLAKLSTAGNSAIDCWSGVDQANLYPESMLGFHLTRMETAQQKGFTVSYRSDYPWMIDHIHDDTARTTSTEGLSPDIRFAITTQSITLPSGQSRTVPRYSTIKFPGAGDVEMTVAFTYGTASAPYNPGSGVTRNVGVLTRVDLPGGYRESFTYNSAPSVAGGLVSTITVPNGAIHEFSYAQLDFAVKSGNNMGNQVDVHINSVGLTAHSLSERAGATGNDRMTWNYTHLNEAAPGCNPTQTVCIFMSRNITKDPTGNTTVYYFANGGGLGRLLQWTEYYAGDVQGTGAVLKKRVTQTWAVALNDKLPRPANHWNYQITSSKTEFFDDLVNGQPGTIIESNEDWDGWGRFTTKRTSGTLVPKQRRTKTVYSLDPAKLVLQTRTTPFAQTGTTYGGGWGIGLGGCSSLNNSGVTQVGDSFEYNVPAVSACTYGAQLVNLDLNRWFPSLPLSTTLEDSPDGVAWTARSRSETRYDAVTGLPTRTLARANPGGAGDPCAAELVPATGEVVTDFYYDPAGNLVLKKLYGADDNSVYRTYYGHGTAPAWNEAPATNGVDATTAAGYVRPACSANCGPDEYVYRTVGYGADFGFDRWSRNYTGSGVGTKADGSGAETDNHQFLNGVQNYTESFYAGKPELYPASGTVRVSRDANNLMTLHTYDAYGRIVANRFLGDGTASDEPVQYAYLNVANTDGSNRLVGVQILRTDTTDAGNQTVLTRDYHDGLGRKVISERRNPDGQFAYQVIHYDKTGNPDLVSNWTFTVPSGVATAACTDAQLADPQANNCVTLTPSFWTDAYLSGFITSTVGKYAKSCYQVTANGSNNWSCSTSAAYDFAGRVRRAERWNGASLVSAVDTEYFGLNVKTIVHGIKTGTSATSDRVTIHYKDGYGQLRVVDEDAAATTGTEQGVDAIYSYDWGGRLVKVNLVKQVALVPFTGGDRYTTTNADYQVRTNAYDTFGRLTDSWNPETGHTRTFTFNAAGGVLESEDDNGRNGRGPGGGALTESVASQPTGNCYHSDPGDPNSPYICPAPSIIPNGAVVRGRAASAGWSATGKGRLVGGSSYAIPGDQLYYRWKLDAGGTYSPWIYGMQTWSQENNAIGGHTLYVGVTYAENLAVEDPTQISTVTVNFSITANGAAYTMVTTYDGRGRPLYLQKKTTAGGGLSTLRQFFYDADSGDCRDTVICGQAKHALAYSSALGTVYHAIDNRHWDGRTYTEVIQLPTLASGQKNYQTVFDYDRFGRQSQAYYPLASGAYDPVATQLVFQKGGVKNIRRANGSVTYATMGAANDYLPDGSLGHFQQGNLVDFTRTEDAAERVASIAYSKTGVGTLWSSGAFAYDMAGNITDIGNDHYYYDRMARLVSAQQSRHGHLVAGQGTQPSTAVSLTYGFDAFGNITSRQKTAGADYTVGKDNAAELFTGRDYTPGADVIPNNLIRATGFVYDGNGNLISDGKKDFIYDELNQQIEVWDATTRVSYTAGNVPADRPWCVAGTPCLGSGVKIEMNAYYADGMRAARETYEVVGGNTLRRRAVYARLGGNVIAEYRDDETAPGVASASHEKRYIYGPLGLLATEELCSQNCKSDESPGVNVTRYYQYDHLATIRAITKADGTLESTYDFEPFGLELQPASGKPAWYTDTNANTHKFTGHERDEETGEDYMKARMYVLSTARFPQIDPMFGGAGDPQNWNPYIYVLNSPVGASDPTGMISDQQNAKNEKSSSAQIDTNTSTAGDSGILRFLMGTFEENGCFACTRTLIVSQQNSGNSLYGDYDNTSTDDYDIRVYYNIYPTSDETGCTVGARHQSCGKNELIVLDPTGRFQLDTKSSSVIARQAAIPSDISATLYYEMTTGDYVVGQGEAMGVLTPKGALRNDPGAVVPAMTKLRLHKGENGRTEVRKSVSLTDGEILTHGHRADDIGWPGPGDTRAAGNIADHYIGTRSGAWYLRKGTTNWLRIAGPGWYSNPKSLIEYLNKHIEIKKD